MEQTVIKINVQDTIDQIVDLSDKIEALKKLQEQYKKELKELITILEKLYLRILKNLV